MYPRPPLCWATSRTKPGACWNGTGARSASPTTKPPTACCRTNTARPTSWAYEAGIVHHHAGLLADGGGRDAGAAAAPGGEPLATSVRSAAAERESAAEPGV